MLNEYQEAGTWNCNQYDSYQALKDTQDFFNTQLPPPCKIVPVSQSNCALQRRFGQVFAGLCIRMQIDARYKGGKAVTGAQISRQEAVWTARHGPYPCPKRHHLIELIDTNQKIRYG